MPTVWIEGTDSEPCAIAIEDAQGYAEDFVVWPGERRRFDVDRKGAIEFLASGDGDGGTPIGDEPEEDDEPGEDGTEHLTPPIRLAAAS